MTIPRDFARDVAAVHDSTDRLLVSLGKLDDDAVGEPSLLPGWTRGHVLAHLARNADALVNLLNWARTGVPTPMYASAAARDEDIERGADRPLKVHLDDLGESAARFEAAARALPENRRAYEVEMRNGVVERADRLALRRLAEVELHHVDIERGADRPLKVHLDDLGESAARFEAAARALPENRRAYEVEMRNGVVERADRLALRRLAEVELHHVDLGVGYTVEQLPDDFVDSELDFLTGIKFARHPKLTALELHADDGRRWRTGGHGSADGASAGPVVVSGSARDLVGWLTGRADGGLLDTHGAPLPVIPPL
ncbi:maleylpyruvate isomerase family mycothiol-dependent enzyme [Streptomyces noursei]|uniref:maleylpyruvate isomerase family mycothiol-dependent enzyme n=1 Tax=Streptomyces noursei TaxID=1971 RepID=UPI0019881F5E|nr:maleylpyruvate isomerase family mycothiol-dependent enzyme [Streptomyces noursei]GGX03450.1 hypothetical protein GCM10010341_26300 [Streptomyces noursei]